MPRQVIGPCIENYDKKVSSLTDQFIITVTPELPFTSPLATTAWFNSVHLF